MSAAEDWRYMQRALELAARGKATTHPNPRVGCVIVRDGRVIAEAWHHWTGKPHAEALALQEAGTAAQRATVYVTLEPCSHFGRTPPCADALVAAHVERVVVAMQDPNPRVAGRGLRKLRAAGINVEVGLGKTEAAELNRAFISRQVRGRPWLSLKLAMSLDGRTALADGSSRWITGAEARADVHRWRAELGAVLSSAETVLTDNARLDVRLPGEWRQPDRIVLDRRGRVPPGAAVWAAGARRFAVVGSDVGQSVRAALEAQGVDVLEGEQDGRYFALRPVLDALGAQQVNGVLAECGPQLAGSLLQARLVDELLVYVAPCLLGTAARPLACIQQPANMDDVARWRLVDSEQIGEDLRLRLRPPDVRADDVSHREGSCSRES